MSGWEGWLWLAWLTATTPIEPAPAERFTESVTVGERLPISRADSATAVSVLDREILAALPAVNLAEALRFTPTVDVFFPADIGGVPMSSARGFFGGGEAEYLQLRIDGVAVADAESGIADWRALRSSDIERVEVLRGPGSALYGDTALGGVVDVTTRRVPGRAVDLEIEGGSFGTALASAGGRPRRWIDLRVESARSDGFRDHAGLENDLLEIALESPAEGTWSWRTGLRASEQSREDPGPLDPEEFRTDPGGSNPRYAEDREDVERARSWVALEGSLPGRSGGPAMRGSVRIDADRRTSDFVRTLLLAPNFGDRLRRDLESQGFGVSGEASRALGSSARFEGHAGVEGRTDELDIAYFPFTDLVGEVTPVASTAARRRRAASFGSLSWAPAKPFRLGVSARADWIDDDATTLTTASRAEAFSPRLAIAWKPSVSDTTTVFFNAGRAFKAPTLDQRFDPRPFPDGSGGSFQLSNPDLEPQRARSVETGVWHGGRRVEGELTLYRTDVDDEIDFDPVTFRYVNLLASRHQGVEASLRGRFGRDSGWRPFLVASYTDVEPRGTGAAPAASTGSAESDRQLKNIPRRRATAGLSAAFPHGISTTVAVAYLGERWLDDAHQFRQPPVSLLDLRVAFDRPAWRLWIDVQNALDEVWVRVGYALPGFDGVAVPYVFPAPGRTLRAGFAFH